MSDTVIRAVRVCANSPPGQQYTILQAVAVNSISRNVCMSWLLRQMLVDSGMLFARGRAGMMKVQFADSAVQSLSV